MFFLKFGGGGGGLKQIVDSKRRQRSGFGLVGRVASKTPARHLWAGKGSDLSARAGSVQAFGVWDVWVRG